MNVWWCEVNFIKYDGHDVFTVKEISDHHLWTDVSGITIQITTSSFLSIIVILFLIDYHLLIIKYII